MSFFRFFGHERGKENEIFEQQEQTVKRHTPSAVLHDMRPTENFLLFLPFGKGVEGGSGQFFSVLFCKTALAYYCLRRFLKKSLENLLPGAALSTLSARHTALYMQP